MGRMIFREVNKMAKSYAVSIGAIVALSLVAVSAAGQTPAPQVSTNVYQIPNGTSESVTPPFAACTVFNNNTGAAIPVFTGSAGEWNALLSHLPGGVSVSSCNPVGLCGLSKFTCNVGVPVNEFAHAQPIGDSWQCQAAGGLSGVCSDGGSGGCPPPPFQCQ